MLILISAQSSRFIFEQKRRRNIAYYQQHIKSTSSCLQDLKVFLVSTNSASNTQQIKQMIYDLKIAHKKTCQLLLTDSSEQQEIK